MVKQKQTKKAVPKKRAIKKVVTEQADSEYLLKIVLYVILGALWLGFKHPLNIGPFVVHGLPLGLFIGLLFASHDKFQIDRKIAYAILIVMTVVTSFLPAAIML